MNGMPQSGACTNQMVSEESQAAVRLNRLSAVCDALSSVTMELESKLTVVLKPFSPEPSSQRAPEEANLSPLSSYLDTRIEDLQYSVQRIERIMRHLDI